MLLELCQHWHIFGVSEVSPSTRPCTPLWVRTTGKESLSMTYRNTLIWLQHNIIWCGGCNMLKVMGLVPFPPIAHYLPGVPWSWKDSSFQPALISLSSKHIWTYLKLPSEAPTWSHGKEHALTRALTKEYCYLHDPSHCRLASTCSSWATTVSVGLGPRSWSRNPGVLYMPNWSALRRL